MIPSSHITGWRHQNPWPDDAQVEQDLIICRALVEIFQVLELYEAFAFRGGTALHKLHIKRPIRYSEDIDLVQLKPEPSGKAIDAIRKVLDSWLGSPKRERAENSFKLIYQVRDLLDLWLGLTHFDLDLQRLVSMFQEYLQAQELMVTRDDFLANMENKIADKRFINDTKALLAADFTWDISEARKLVESDLIALLR